MTHLFTKSRFKIGLECPTKLFYLDRMDEQKRPVFKNRMSEDTFLQFLADGGHMVGEFAKFTVHESPNDPDITVRERGYEESLAETNRRLQGDLPRPEHHDGLAFVEGGKDGFRQGSLNHNP